MNCKNCGQELEINQAFFPTCGKRVTTDNESKATTSSANLAQSIKNDIGNSESINMVKNKVSDINNGKKKKIGIIVAVAVVLIVAMSILTHINTCDNCDKTYVGKKHYVIIWGEGGNLCNDCFRRYVLDD